jgi:hypothetical protein
MRCHRPAPNTPGGQWRAAVKHADVVQAQKAAFKEVFTEAVFSVHPPGKVEHELSKRPSEKRDVAFAVQSFLGPVQKDGRPCLHRRVHIAEVPLESRDLAARVKVVVKEH